MAIARGEPRNRHMHFRKPPREYVTASAAMKKTIRCLFVPCSASGGEPAIVSCAVKNRTSPTALGSSAAILLVALAGAPLAKADVLASFSLTGSMRTSEDGDPNSTASAITDGPGFTSVINPGVGNPTPALTVVSTLTDGATQSAAVTAEDYFTFTLSPASGGSFSLTSLTFDYANYSTDGTFPATTFFVRSSVNNFSANTASGVTALASSDGVFANAAVTLSAATFQNVTTPIEFRIYVSDGTTDPDRGAALDNIILNGTAVPEPATGFSLLSGLGLLGLLRRRKRSF